MEGGQKGTEALSTSLSQPQNESTWKQEVSQRLAAHKSQKGFSAASQTAPSAAARQGASGRAAQAAARVAARFAQVPSYSQMQSAEARAALRAAEVATQAALEAQTAAQAALEDLRIATNAGPRLCEPEAPQAEAPVETSARDRESVPVQFTVPSSLEAWENECSHVLWAPDLRLRPLDPAESSAPRRVERAASSAGDWWERSDLAENPWESEEIEPVEPVQPIYANLIEFPRELVATRKMRPQLIDGPFAEEEADKQLSIFEVDPASISTQPEADSADSASAWRQPEWSGIELEAQPLSEAESEEEPVSPLAPQLASLGRRMTAALVDHALIASVFLGAALMVMPKVGSLAGALPGHLPAAKIMEAAAVVAFLLLGLVYQTLCLVLAGVTPGMRCARVSFCTFDGQIPSRAQLCSRLGALLLSVLPVGLGIVWVLFDDEHLSWHDRISRTYPRSY
jgi:uncharacterized RDD family membrane protein YckC